MKTPPNAPSGPHLSNRSVPASEPSAQQSQWRCTNCDKLLGIRRDARMHLRFARGHEYFAGFPIVATCRGCGTLNEASSAAR